VIGDSGGGGRDGDDVDGGVVGDGVTEDTLLRGRVRLLQPAQGFRVGLDPILLSAFAAPPYGRFVDVGCGSGALAFLLCAADAAATGVAVEIQGAMAALAERGRAVNGLDARLEIVAADVRAAVGRPPLPRAAFDLVAVNPPFREIGSSLTSPDASRAQATHEITLALDEWLDVAAALVRPGGRVAVVFAAARLTPLLAGLGARSLAPERLRLVHPRLDLPASRVLVEARRGPPRPLAVEPPLGLHDPDGGYTLDVRRMLGEG